MDNVHSTSASENSTPESAVGILDKYYSTVKPLRQYLDDVFKLSSGNVSRLVNLSRNGDKDVFLDLLTTCYVGVKQTPRLSLRVYPAALEMHEVIDQAQSRVFRSKRGQNVITSGYRLAQHSDDMGKAGMARSGITNFFVNTIINVFYGIEWRTLLQRRRCDDPSAL
ncbi:hypothetical protein CPB83DRAFT_412148 [Crepidotus variabilis]|uniref:Uncharacterized protein n=1 Tax=Crepidotus variabilis TaxID=179855 RepID=A0A9P6ERK4_9AGAR|nr:hypothetical protein CPB83DRAFT_412148 [Crepidotus variabilis]